MSCAISSRLQPVGSTKGKSVWDLARTLTDTSFRNIEALRPAIEAFVWPPMDPPANSVVWHKSAVKGAQLRNTIVNLPIKH
jgi:hypothetical protein